MPDFPDLDAVPEPQRIRLREALEGKLGLGDGWTFRGIVPGARRQDGAPNVFRAVLDHADGRTRELIVDADRFGHGCITWGRKADRTPSLTSSTALAARGRSPPPAPWQR